MTDLEQLIETANRLSQNLEKIAADERRWGFELQYRLEKISWEIYCSAIEMKNIKNYVG